MNTTRLVATLALTFAAASAALAQEAIYDYPQATASQVSRSAVLADLKLARSEGRLLVSEASVGGPEIFRAERSREAVRAEAQLAIKSGRANLLSAEPQAFSIDTLPSQPTLTLASK